MSNEKEKLTEHLKRCNQETEATKNMKFNMLFRGLKESVDNEYALPPKEILKQLFDAGFVHGMREAGRLISRNMEMNSWPGWKHEGG